MTDQIRVAVFDTLEAANAFKEEAARLGGLRAPTEAPTAADNKFVVKVYGGPLVARQHLGVLRDGVLTID